MKWLNRSGRKDHSSGFVDRELPADGVFLQAKLPKPSEMAAKFLAQGCCVIRIS